MNLDAVQDHLLVGMDAPAAGARDRRGVPAAVSVVPVARRDPAAAAAAAVDDLRRRRRARRGRLVDGVVGPRRHARQRVAIPAGVPSDACLRDLRRDPVDRAADCAARPARSAVAAAASGAGHRRLAAGANLSRRAGRRARRRLELQHLAADRRRAHSAARRGCGSSTALAQSVREHAHGAVQSSHGGLCDVAAGDAACRRRLAAAR